VTLAACTDLNPEYNVKYWDGRVDAQTVVIYPEIIKDNPLEGAHVVRWLLRPNREPWPGELVMAWQDNYTVDYDGVLYVPIIDRRFFNRINSGNRAGSVGYRAGPDVQITEDWPTNWNMLSDLFKHAQVFYCGDPLTALAGEAALCGCPVVMTNGDEGQIKATSADFERDYDEYEAKCPALLDAFVKLCADKWGLR